MSLRAAVDRVRYGQPEPSPATKRVFDEVDGRTPAARRTLALHAISALAVSLPLRRIEEMGSWWEAAVVAYFFAALAVLAVVAGAALGEAFARWEAPRLDDAAVAVQRASGVVTVAALAFWLFT
jgi:hypothetical protein